MGYCVPSTKGCTIQPVAKGTCTVTLAPVNTELPLTSLVHGLWFVGLPVVASARLPLDPKVHEPTRRPESLKLSAGKAIVRFLHILRGTHVRTWVIGPYSIIAMEKNPACTFAFSQVK